MERHVEDLQLPSLLYNVCNGSFVFSDIDVGDTCEGQLLLFSLCLFVFPLKI